MCGVCVRCVCGVCVCVCVWCECGVCGLCVYVLSRRLKATIKKLPNVAHKERADEAKRKVENINGW